VGLFYLIKSLIASMNLPSVFMIGWEFPPHNSGGLGTACEGLTSALSKAHINQTFVLPHQLPFDADFAQVFNPLHPYINFVHVNMQLFPYGALTQEDYLYLKKRKLHSKSSMVDQALAYAETVGYLANFYPHDVIHAHDWMTYPAAFAASKNTHKPVILHVHSTEFDRTLNGNTNAVISQIEYEGLAKADHVITVSQYTKNIICDKYAVDTNKVHVVHNGVDLNRQRNIQIDNNLLKNYLNGKKVIIFVGRFTSQKGPDYFVTIADKIIKEIPEAMFIMAGSGDMYHQILMQSANSRLTGKLLFAGFLRNFEREFLYRRADLFIMPSVSEPFGIVALEAAGENTPVIISKQSGVSEVLTDALSANFWDTDLISTQAISVLKNNNYQNDLGHKLCQQAQQITWDKAAYKCIDVYKEMSGL